MNKEQLVDSVDVAFDRLGGVISYKISLIGGTVIHRTKSSIIWLHRELMTVAGQELLLLHPCPFSVYEQSGFDQLELLVKYGFYESTTIANQWSKFLDLQRLLPRQKRHQSDDAAGQSTEKYYTQVTSQRKLLQINRWLNSILQHQSDRISQCKSVEYFMSDQFNENLKASGASVVSNGIKRTIARVSMSFLKQIMPHEYHRGIRLFSNDNTSNVLMDKQAHYEADKKYLLLVEDQLVNMIEKYYAMIEHADNLARYSYQMSSSTQSMDGIQAFFQIVGKPGKKLNADLTDRLKCSADLLMNLLIYIHQLKGFLNYYLDVLLDYYVADMEHQKASDTLLRLQTNDEDVTAAYAAKEKTLQTRTLCQQQENECKQKVKSQFKMFAELRAATLNTFMEQYGSSHMMHIRQARSNIQSLLDKQTNESPK
ncbi:hypothetical protein MP228_009356 [Amoeboaphelidium protococcarum]|nr:hypothetical protein MP228_009356 [Amoeboaphelidium protococcarum]